MGRSRTRTPVYAHLTGAPGPELVQSLSKYTLGEGIPLTLSTSATSPYDGHLCDYFGTVGGHGSVMLVVIKDKPGGVGCTFGN